MLDLSSAQWSMVTADMILSISKKKMGQASESRKNEDWELYHELIWITVSRCVATVTCGILNLRVYNYC